MAGEWIKVEITTPDKPELMKAARILGVDRDLEFGKLVRLWGWFDKNSVDGHVDGVVSTDVDQLVDMEGFCEALKSVGWLEYDDDAEIVSLPNFDVHNGETAKQRASRNKRQAKWRGNVDANVDKGASTKTSTREEKRSEYNNRGFAPPSVEEVREYCKSRNNGIDPEQFVAFYGSKGWMIGKNKMKDWKQAIITWESQRKQNAPESEVRAGGV